jgi:hypothetical protein
MAAALMVSSVSLAMGAGAADLAPGSIIGAVVAGTVRGRPGRSNHNSWDGSRKVRAQCVNRPRSRMGGPLSMRLTWAWVSPSQLPKRSWLMGRRWWGWSR